MPSESVKLTEAQREALEECSRAAFQEIAPRTGPQAQTLRALTARGLVEPGRPTAGLAWVHLTLAGREALAASQEKA